jgi:3-dehydroquinate dehydratase/shikimate dehydrogenase
MKLCLSIAPRSMPEALAALQRVHRSRPDIIELRIDGLNDIDLPLLLQSRKLPIIITNRRVDEGGLFSGSASEQRLILSEAMAHGVDYIDVEASWGTRMVQDLISRNSRTKLIVSHHDFDKTPINLLRVYDRLAAMGGHVVKIATMAHDSADNARMLALYARSRRNKLIALCMGEHGHPSRILAGVFGCYLSYASEGSDSATAPGQLAIDDLKKIYRVNILNRTTRIFGLVGNPVRHSRGIYFHNRIFAQRSVNAVYVNFLTDNLERFVEFFRPYFRGLSITMPFKQAIVPLLDRVESSALRVGAVNTVINQRGKLVGHNTDFDAVAHLLRKRLSLTGKQAVVLGTGGTARTMAAACIDAGAHVTIMGRSNSKAAALASVLDCEWKSLTDLESLHIDILLNGTSVGMISNDANEIVPPSLLKRGMIVFDAVYDPAMTPLLQRSEATGCKTISGLEFFRAQARLQSQLFLNVC